MADLLTPANGDEHVEGGSEPNLVAQLYDNDSDTLNKAAIKTLTMSIFDENEDVVNGRDEVSVLDTSIGTLASDGTVTLKFDDADMAFLATTGNIEKRSVRLTWTYDDTDGDERKGVKTWKIPVQKPV